MKDLRTLHYPLSTDHAPDGWELCSLSQFVEDMQTGFASGEHNSDGYGIPHLRPMNVSSDGKLDLSDGRFVDPSKNDLRLQRGDVLFNNTNSPAWVGKTALVDTDKELAFSNHMTRLRTCVDIDARFVAMQLHFLCRSGYFQHQCKKHVNQASINRDFLSELTPFCLPPSAEQQRIADKLDSLLSRVDSCRERLDRVPSILKRFRQSVLAAATSGKLTENWREENRKNLGSWSTLALGDILTDIQSGVNVKCEERPPYQNEKGLVKISAVTWGRYDDEESKTIPESHNIPEYTRIEIGDFLISRANTLELVASCVIVEETTRPVYLSDKVLRLVMADEMKLWILFCLRSPNGRVQIERLSSGNQLSMRNISQKNLRCIEVPFPNEEERVEIVRRMTNLLSFADELEKRFRSAKLHIDQLTPSLLAKAFRGELVPQDPNDEPASVLLERIRTAKSDTKAKTKKRKTKVG